MILRSSNDHELFPDAISVIGAPEDGDGLVMEYFDSRGVRRTYGIAFDGRRPADLARGADHDQRFTATPAADTSSASGRWPYTPGDWNDDLKVVYRRRA